MLQAGHSEGTHEPPDPPAPPLPPVPPEQRQVFSGHVQTRLP